MRIKQGYVSSGIKTFRKNYLDKFRLTEYRNPRLPIVIFGMYEEADYRLYLNILAPFVVVWCGTDATMITRERAAILKMKHAVHVAKSKFISDDLIRHGIKHKVIPVTWQTPNYAPCARGENIFHYGDGFHYGESFLPLIRRATGLNIVLATHKTYDKAALKKVYESCFIGLRLTKHDGVPNTVLELGMMGRRCIYNGDIPGSIPWNGLTDICTNIMQEYSNRANDDTAAVAEAVKEFINIDDNWLNV